MFDSSNAYSSKRWRVGIALLVMGCLLVGGALALSHQLASKSAGPSCLPGAMGTAVASGQTVVVGWEPSPRGDRAAFVVYDNGRAQGEIHVLNLASGSRVSQTVIKDATHLTWCPSGDRIVFVKDAGLDYEQPTPIAAYSLLKHSSTNLTSGFKDDGPAWNGKGTAVAFTRVYQSGSQVGRQLEVLHFGTEAVGSPQCITRQQGGISSPKWRPLGDEIGYIGWTTGFSSDDKFTVSRDLYLVNVLSGRVQKITTSGDVSKSAWTWSPDGAQIAFATEIGITREFNTMEVMDVTTLKRKVVVRREDLETRQSPVLNTIRWSPDGRYLLFDVATLDNPQSSDIALVQWQGGKAAQLTRGATDTLPRWSPDGKTILYVRHTSELWRMQMDGSHQQKLITISDGSQR